MIRAADFVDIPAISEMLDRAMSETHYDKAIVSEIMSRRILFACIYGHKPGGEACVFLSENDGKLDGIFVGVIRPFYEITQLTLASCMIWWTAGNRPRSGIGLLSAFEDWVAENHSGAIIRIGITDSFVDPNRVLPLLERRGFRLSGLVIEKET